MQEEAAAIAVQSNRLPEKSGLWSKTKAFVLQILGQFSTISFWMELLRTVTHEAITSIIIAFGGSLLWYGREKSNKSISSTITGAAGPAPSAAMKAFGGPTPYQPSSGYPVAPRTTGDTRFPGFG